MATPTYDPKKAELYNKLRKTGISEDQAWTQAESLRLKKTTM
jgi:hypothetical protein